MTTVSAIVLCTCVFCFFFANIAQSRFSSGLAGRMSPMNLFQMGWMGAACLVLLFYKLLSGGLSLSLTTVLLAGTAGVLQIISGMSLLYGLSVGPLGVTMLIFSMYIVVPPLLSALFLHESTSGMQLAGIALIVAVLVISNGSSPLSEGKKTSGRWWAVCVLSAVCCGLASFCIQVHQAMLPGLEQREYTIVSYAFGTLTAFLFYQVLRRRDQKRGQEAYQITVKGFWLPVCGMALGQTGAQICNLFNASRLPAIVLYPVTQLSTLMLTTVYGILVLRERLRAADVACLVLGCIAIVLMNL